MGLLLLTLSVATASPSDTTWPQTQKGVRVMARDARRTVYTADASGDRLFQGFRNVLTRRGWTVIDTVWSGPLRYMRARQDATVVDVALQNGTKRCRLTVTTSTSKSHAGLQDRVLDANDESTVVVAGGGAVAVNGDRCDFRVRGACSIVRVNGNHDTVNVECPLAVLLVTGDDNRVRWKRSKNPLPPVVTNSGARNDVAGY